MQALAQTKLSSRPTYYVMQHIYNEPSIGAVENIPSIDALCREPQVDFQYGMTKFPKAFGKCCEEISRNEIETLNSSASNKFEMFDVENRRERVEK